MTISENPKTSIESPSSVKMWICYSCNVRSVEILKKKEKKSTDKMPARNPTIVLTLLLVLLFGDFSCVKSRLIQKGKRGQRGRQLICMPEQLAFRPIWISLYVRIRSIHSVRNFCTNKRGIFEVYFRVLYIRRMQTKGNSLKAKILSLRERGSALSMLLLLCRNLAVYVFTAACVFRRFFFLYILYLKY